MNLSSTFSSTPPRLLTSLLPALAVFCVNAAAAPPNIVCILVGDLGYADMGFNGSNQVPLPPGSTLAH